MQRPPLPAWLAPERRPGLSRSHKQSFDYWTKIYWATPPWTTKEMKQQIREIKKARKPGEETDHIVPLKSHLVCGLHVPWNLENKPSKLNNQKSNTWWPDCPFEQDQLFDYDIEPHQLSLL